ncbi:hypothetical protein D0Z03_002546 [Geotrichum reessii]|nr:hypothetical protein D0Z03_002546 [Galactomyces reessii]
MSQEALIVLDASVVAQPDAVSSLTDRFQSTYKVHRQVLDRLSSKTILSNHYAYIYVAPENVTLSATHLQVLFDALIEGGRLEGPINYKAQTLNAIMTGFVENDAKTGYTKPQSNASTATLLKKSSNATNTKKKLIFKRAIDLAAPEDDDDLVDEDSLISSTILSQPIVIPEKCATTAGGKKRRKACKDCTCGLKELEQQELERQNQQQSVVTLNLDEEIDFTVPGKAVGSCGSCALGDAFRCDGCPYLGLPPFKPGEVVSVGGVRGDY